MKFHVSVNNNYYKTNSSVKRLPAVRYRTQLVKRKCQMLTTCPNDPTKRQRIQGPRGSRSCGKGNWWEAGDPRFRIVTATHCRRKLESVSHLQSGAGAPPLGKQPMHILLHAWGK